MVNKEDIRKELYVIYRDANIIVNDNNYEDSEPDYFEVEVIEDLDSIKMIATIVEIEVFFDIEIPDEYLATNLLSNFNNMVDIIEEQLAIKKDVT